MYSNNDGILKFLIIIKTYEPFIFLLFAIIIVFTLILICSRLGEIREKLQNIYNLDNFKYNTKEELRKINDNEDYENTENN